MSEHLSADVSSTGLRRVVLIVALLNLAYFGVEFAVALSIGSVSLFADSVDFLEDASVNLLIVVALAWTAESRARVGTALAGIRLSSLDEAAPPIRPQGRGRPPPVARGDHGMRKTAATQGTTT